MIQLVRYLFPRSSLLSRCVSYNVAESSKQPAHPKALSRVYFLNQYSEPELSLTEALKCLRAYSISERAETVEVSLNCNMKMSKGKVLGSFRGYVNFLHSFGKDKKILMFIEESNVAFAHEAGVDIAGGSELISKIQNDGLPQFDVCLCTLGMLPEVKKLQKVLRTKMPSEKRSTVVEDVTEAVISHFKRSKEFQSDRSLVNMAIGKLCFTDIQIQDNLNYLLEAVLKHKGNLPKSSFIKSIIVSSSYGPGFKLIKTFK